MKKAILVLIVFLVLPLSAFGKKDPFVESVKEKAKDVFRNSKLFEVAKAEYNKRPEQAGGINVYTLELDVSKKLGEGVVTFVKYPNPTSNTQKVEEIKPVYATVTFKVGKYIDKAVKMSKVSELPLHLADDETFAVYQKQRLVITWLGDGAWGAKGFHLYAYKETLAKE